MSNAALVEQDSDGNTIDVEFDLSWSNSWRDSTNYDAAWVFFKYSTDSGSSWNHATLKTSGTNPSGFSRGSGTTIDLVVPTDKKGLFAQRSSPGSGSLSTTDVQAVWDYGQDGLTDSDASAGTTLIKVFATEMVYIPEGGFFAGDGNTGASTYEFEYGGSATSAPGGINSEAVMSFGSSSAQWYYNSGGNTGETASGATFEVHESFPKGYQAFYVMKYEITEGQWIGYFNTLPSAAKTNRDITSNTNGGKNSDSVKLRNTIAWSSGDATSSREDRVMNYISWMDLCSYLDWAALRPMTELEYEKAARGPIYPTASEYAWGTTSATQCGALSTGDETGTTTCTTASANVHFGNNTLSGGDTAGGMNYNKGAVRSGIFATSSTVTRATTGASYYGVMELSGNVWERVVTVGHSTGRGYSGTHGDGILITLSSYEGNATNPDWPGISSTASQGVTAATGSGFRGSAWQSSTASQLQISARPWAAKNDSTRNEEYGGRGVRTAP